MLAIMLCRGVEQGKRELRATRQEGKRDHEVNSALFVNLGIVGKTCLFPPEGTSDITSWYKIIGGSSSANHFTAVHHSSHIK